MLACVAPLLNLFVSLHDTRMDGKKKEIFTLCLIATSVVVFCAHLGMFGNIIALTGLGVVVITNVIIAARVATKKKLDSFVIAAQTVSYMFAVFSYDLLYSTMGKTATWTVLVVVLDLHLFFGVQRKYTHLVVCVTLVWAGLLDFERYVRFGLLDIPGTPAYEDRQTICDKPPCSSIGASFFLQTFVLLVDFSFTKTFADGLMAEKRTVEASIATANSIATSLAAFDLDKVEVQLSSATIPSELYEAFERILRNLRQYRPYIPDALLEEMFSSSLSIDRAAPGLTSKEAAIVFTDIQGSSATWEACPEGMKKGLRVHDGAMRECIYAFNGYEVKTIGDAFMVAFEDTIDAVRFSLDVQEQLVHSEWPAELLALEHLAWDGNGPWCGLRVRIGVHYGEVDVQLNTLTGRYDYFGHTVNKAARMEGACVGGSVAVTEQIIAETLTVDMISIDMGEVELKGVGKTRGHLVLPTSLKDRREYVESQLRFKPENRKLVKRMPRKISTSAATGGLLCAMGTVVLVEMRFNFGEHAEDVLSDMLSRVATSAERCEGTITSLQGCSVAIGWNTSRKCLLHVEKSVRFASVLSAALEINNDNAEQAVHIGLCTGDLLFGSAGTFQRFITMIGRAVAFSSLLCNEAVNTNTYCCCGSLKDEIPYSGSEFVKQLSADVGDGPQSLRVYKLLVSTECALVSSSEYIDRCLSF